MNSLPFRQIHLDFHTSGSIAGIGSRFSKEQFQEALRLGHVNSITIFSKCHHGWSYHPTRVNRMHPGLSFDLLKAQLEACAETGVRAPKNIWKRPATTFCVITLPTSTFSPHRWRKSWSSTIPVKSFLISRTSASATVPTAGKRSSNTARTLLTPRHSAGRANGSTPATVSGWKRLSANTAPTPQFSTMPEMSSADGATSPTGTPIIWNWKASPPAAGDTTISPCRQPMPEGLAWSFLV